MNAMPRIKRTRGERRGTDGLMAMPPMPGKSTPTARPQGEESTIYGGGTRAMRANIAKIHGFGPNPAIEPDAKERQRPIDAAKSSKAARAVNYSDATAMVRLAALIKAMA